MTLLQEEELRLIMRIADTLLKPAGSQFSETGGEDRLDDPLRLRCALIREACPAGSGTRFVGDSASAAGQISSGRSCARQSTGCRERKSVPCWQNLAVAGSAVWYSDPAIYGFRRGHRRKRSHRRHYDTMPAYHPSSRRSARGWRAACAGQTASH